MSYSVVFGKAVCFLLLLAFLPSVFAWPAPSVTVIPEKVSVNGTYIVSVDPHTDLPVTLQYKTMSPVGFYEFGFLVATIPRVDENNWMCVFSNDPDIATCGFSPFIMTKKDFNDNNENCDQGIFYGCSYVRSYGVSGDYNNDSAYAKIGGIQVEVVDMEIGESNVSMTVSTGGVYSTVDYKVYHKNLTLFKDAESLEFLSQSGFYRGYFDIIPGDFYVVFEARKSDGSDFGGTVINLTIPKSAAYQDICPGVTEYGSGVITITPVEWDTTIDKYGYAEKKNFKISNSGNDTLKNLSIELSGDDSDLSDYISFELPKTTLMGQDFMYFTVRVEDLEYSTRFIATAHLLENGTRVADIPMNIGVSVREACEGMEFVQAPENVMSFDHYTWAGVYLMERTVSDEIRITNNGDADLEDLSYTISGAIDSVIRNITLPDKIDVGDSEKMIIYAKGKKARTYSGTITIDSNQGAEKVLVSLTFMRDISQDLDTLETDLMSFENYFEEDLPEDIEYILSDIGSKISSARSDIDTDDYDTALEKYQDAYFSLSALNSMVGFISESQEQPAGDGGFTVTIIIIVAIAGAAGFGLWYYFTKIKKGGGEFGDESDIENEDELDF